MRFVDVNVSGDFNVSFTFLLNEVRRALHLNPFTGTNNNNNNLHNDNNNNESMIVTT